jgi:hypothetical protein
MIWQAHHSTEQNANQEVENQGDACSTLLQLSDKYFDLLSKQQSNTRHLYST